MSVRDVFLQIQALSGVYVTTTVFRYFLHFLRVVGHCSHEYGTPSRYVRSTDTTATTLVWMKGLPDTFRSSTSHALRTITIIC